MFGIKPLSFFTKTMYNIVKILFAMVVTDANCKWYLVVLRWVMHYVHERLFFLLLLQIPNLAKVLKKFLHDCNVSLTMERLSQKYLIYFLYDKMPLCCCYHINASILDGVFVQIFQCGFAPSKRDLPGIIKCWFFYSLN